MAQAAAAAAQAIKSQVKKLPELHGVVVSAGLMDKTVKVRVGGQKWNNYVKKVQASFPFENLSDSQTDD